MTIKNNGGLGSHCSRRDICSQIKKKKKRIIIMARKGSYIEKKDAREKGYLEEKK